MSGILECVACKSLFTKQDAPDRKCSVCTGTCEPVELKDVRPTADIILQNIFSAAEQHGKYDGLQFEVSDLKGLVEAAWRIMPVAQKREFLEDIQVELVLDGGANGEYGPDELQDTLEAVVVSMEDVITRAGYELVAEGDPEDEFYKWRKGEKESGVFLSRREAVENAYTMLLLIAKHG
jgi:hypothetical protein